MNSITKAITREQKAQRQYAHKLASITAKIDSILKHEGDDLDVREVDWLYSLRDQVVDRLNESHKPY